ncbi:MAG: hypothetical protein ACREJ3_07035, partial [Polyangiaceae bacterium]
MILSTDRRFLFVCVLALGIALDACASISGLDQYDNGNGSAGAGVSPKGAVIQDAGADATTSTDGPLGGDATGAGSGGDGDATGAEAGYGAMIQDAGEDATTSTDGPLGGDASCPSSAPTMCSGTCVDTTSSVTNCGACGAPCAGGATCSASVCTGASPDAGPDGCSPIALPPSVDVDATQWAANFKTSPAWNCNAAGTTTLDSTAGTITSTSCALGTLDFTNNVTQSVAGGPAVMVVRLTGLTVTKSHILKLQGDKPIVFLVSGNVTVDTGGMINADSSGTTRGAGGDYSGCGTSAGTASNSMSTGGGGGGFGTAGGYGASPSGSSGSAGGIAAAGLTLQPLRGGCTGGVGGSSSPAGAGGGAVEISASGTITIGHAGDTSSTTGTLTAAGGGSVAASGGQNVGSGGGGSGGAIVFVSPVAATFSGNGAARAHGGGSGAGEG